MSGNSKVLIAPRFVEKICADPVGTAEKYDRIHEISKREGFDAPAVLNVRSDRIRLERIMNIRPIFEIYLNLGREDDARSTFCDIGRTLGVIHEMLQPGSRHPATWAPPSGFESALRRFGGAPDMWKRQAYALLHGDYSFANVFIRRDDPSRIVVLDPCANYGSTFSDWTFGPVALDLGKMVACLEGQVPRRFQLSRPCRAAISEMQERFLAGYRSVRSAVPETRDVHAFAYAVADAQFKRRFGLAGGIRTAALYNRVRGNFPAKALEEGRK